MFHWAKNNTETMEQTINILTERERQLDDIARAVRDTEYPPLNGGPTVEELAGLLKGAAATIEELGDRVDGMEDDAERCEELQSAINDAVEALDDVIINLTLAAASGELADCKALEAIQDAIQNVRSDLRRA